MSTPCCSVARRRRASPPSLPSRSWPDQEGGRDVSQSRLLASRNALATSAGFFLSRSTAAFIEVMQLLLEHGHLPAIATHDPDMIDATRKYAAARGVPPARYEFQMLYGIRRDLQTALHNQGYGVRVYVPFGREWFPYFMRRLGERPANIGFVIRGLLRERSTQMAL